LSIFLTFFRRRFRLLEEVAIKTRGNGIIFRFFHNSADEVFPLLLGLLDFDHMSKEPTFDFRQIESIVDNNFDPELVVFKGQIKDKSSRASQLFFQLVVEKVQHIFIFYWISVLELSQNKLFNR
jgi:hypothetical protein